MQLVYALASLFLLSIECGMTRSDLRSGSKKQHAQMKLGQLRSSLPQILHWLPSVLGYTPHSHPPSAGYMRFPKDKGWGIEVLQIEYEECFMVRELNT